jgi:NADPH:quinone reductase-like Zn-dependent oxidoreductase
VVLNPLWGCGACEYCRDGEVPKCLRVHMLGEMDPGGLAEYVKVPAAQAIALPDGYPFEEAACLPITFGTAWRMLVTHARVQPGEDVLVHGAVGGVGLAAVQIAKLAGARVFATASTADKLERATELGADVAINYLEDREWDATVRRLTGKRGMDVIVETVGAATWERSIRALGKGGRLVTSGATSGPLGPTDIRYLFRREHTIQGSNGWTHNDLLTITRLAFAGKLKPLVDRVLPLERAADGERAMARREVIGKVVIRP